MGCGAGSCHVAAQACSCPVPGGEGRGAGFAAGLTAGAQPARWAPAGAKFCSTSAPVSIPLRASASPRRASCILRLSLPLPEVQGAGGSGIEGRQGRQISRTSLRPPFCQPVCLAVASYGELGAKSAEAGPTLLVKIHLCLAHCPYLGQS